MTNQDHLFAIGDLVRLKGSMQRLVIESFEVHEGVIVGVDADGQVMRGSRTFAVCIGYASCQRHQQAFDLDCIEKTE